MKTNKQPDLAFADVAPLDAAEQDAMVRARRERDGQMTDAAETLERLRLEQVEIEKKHAELAELGQKQDVYQRAKRDVSQRLERALIALDKQSADYTKSLEIIGETKQLLQQRMDAVRAIDESGWDRSDFEEALNRSFGIVDDADAAYARGMAKVEATSWAAAPAAPLAGGVPSSAGPRVQSEGVPRHFLFWLKAGFAFTLPLAVIVLLLCYVLLFLNGYW
jgi:vacuolar-type H+-ATPase subunit I/STV1